MFRLIGKLILAHLLLYTAGAAFLYEFNSRCLGWECQEVRCPDGYAVRLPDGALLPCSDFDLYMETQNKELLR